MARRSTKRHRGNANLDDGVTRPTSRLRLACREEERGPQPVWDRRRADALHGRPAMEEARNSTPRAEAARTGAQRTALHKDGEKMLQKGAANESKICRLATAFLLRFIHSNLPSYPFQIPSRKVTYLSLCSCVQIVGPLLQKHCFLLSEYSLFLTRHIAPFRADCQ